MEDFPIYEIGLNNIRIIDSCYVSKKDFDFVLNTIREDNPDNVVMSNRKNPGMRREWATHNLLYSLHLWRDHTKDVDLNYPQKWYVSLTYGIVGFFAMLFIK